MKRREDWKDGEQRERSHSAISVINTGTTSLILIFGLLALLTFAVLSFSAARVNGKEAEKLAQRMSEYYRGESLAVEMLARERDLYRERTERTEVKSVTDQEVTAADLPDERIELEVAVNDRQSISVCADPKEGKILRWKLIQTQDWRNRQTYQLVQESS